MKSPTTPRRSYNAAGRRAAAERSRHAVVLACRDLLIKDGYQATTIRAVAERAGVSPEMIYKAFGGKQQLMKAVYDVTLAGDLEPNPMAQRAMVMRVQQPPDPRERIELIAKFVRDFHDRLGGILTVLTEADPEVAEVRATTENERLADVRAFVARLASEGHLRPTTSVALATDACWTLTSPQVFNQLTQARSWSPDTYQQWLAEMLMVTLLP